MNKSFSKSHSDSNLSEPNNITDIDVSAIITENNILKQQNEKLYRKTKNQKRKLLRLKKKIYAENKEETISFDNQWEDVEEVLASLNE